MNLRLNHWWREVTGVNRRARATFEERMHEALAALPPNHYRRNPETGRWERVEP